MYREERDEADSKEGESRLFLRQYCMSSGNPFYHFAACNMCSFPLSHSTNILVSFCLQHHGPTMRYPHVLSASLFHSPLMNLLPVLALVYKRVNGANPTSAQIRMCFLSSGPPSSPAHRVWPKGSPLWASQPATLCPHGCQRCGHRKCILLRTLFVTAASPRQGCKQMLYFWSPHGLTLTVANLPDHVWFAACMLT